MTHSDSPFFDLLLQMGYQPNAKTAARAERLWDLASRDPASLSHRDRDILADFNWERETGLVNRAPKASRNVAHLPKLVAPLAQHGPAVADLEFIDLKFDWELITDLL